MLLQLIRMTKIKGEKKNNKICQRRISYHFGANTKNALDILKNTLTFGIVLYYKTV